MGNVIFKCPQTGLNVQHWLDDAEPDNPPSAYETPLAYETVVCQACKRLHFINRLNGRLLGQQED
jgi:hypothetical protein